MVCRGWGAKKSFSHLTLIFDWRLTFRRRASFIFFSKFRVCYFTPSLTWLAPITALHSFCFTILGCNILLNRFSNSNRIRIFTIFAEKTFILWLLFSFSLNAVVVFIHELNGITWVRKKSFLSASSFSFGILLYFQYNEIFSVFFPLPINIFFMLFFRLPEKNMNKNKSLFKTFSSLASLWPLAFFLSSFHAADSAPAAAADDDVDVVFLLPLIWRRWRPTTTRRGPRRCCSHTLWYICRAFVTVSMCTSVRCAAARTVLHENAAASQPGLRLLGDQLCVNRWVSS